VTLVKVETTLRERMDARTMDARVQVPDDAPSAEWLYRPTAVPAAALPDASAPAAALAA
jgi:hypothetical protein